MGPAAQILEQLEQLTTIVCGVFYPRGFKVNFGPDKTAIMVQFWGSGKQEVYRELWHVRSGHLHLPPTPYAPDGFAVAGVVA